MQKEFELTLILKERHLKELLNGKVKGIAVSCLQGSLRVIEDDAEAIAKNILFDSQNLLKKLGEK